MLLYIETKKNSAPGSNDDGKLTTSVLRNSRVSLTQVKVMTLDVSTSDNSSNDHDTWRVGWRRTVHEMFCYNVMIIIIGTDFITLLFMALFPNSITSILF